MGGGGARYGRGGVRYGRGRSEVWEGEERGMGGGGVRYGRGRSEVWEGRRGEKLYTQEKVGRLPDMAGSGCMA